MGITPYDNHSGLAVIYRYKSYNGYGNTMQHPQLFPTRSYQSTTLGSSANFGLKHGITNDSSASRNPNDYEKYNSIELRGKFFVHRRLELNLIVPLVMNYSLQEGENTQAAGLGDLIVYAGFHAVSRSMEEKLQQRLILGAGVKFATGKYDRKSEDGDRIDYLMQTGTGSTDYLFILNYILAYKKIGMNVNSSFKLNGDNFYTEKIGNSSTSYLNLFYKFRQEKDLKLFPSIQAYYEYSDGLSIAGHQQPSTTMSLATAGVGVDVYYKQFGLNTSFQLPIYEEKFESNMVNAGRIMVGINFNFNQKNYLLHKKAEN